VELDWDRRPALGVVMAAAGYPLHPRKGDVITGLPKETATTRWCFMREQPAAAKDTVILSAGGRVLCVTALGIQRQSRPSSAPMRWHSGIQV
jgi:phosphoribosylamine--glycine ligase